MCVSVSLAGCGRRSCGWGVFLSDLLRAGKPSKTKHGSKLRDDAAPIPCCCPNAPVFPSSQAKLPTKQRPEQGNQATPGERQRMQGSPFGPSGHVSQTTPIRPRSLSPPVATGQAWQLIDNVFFGKKIGERKSAEGRFSCCVAAGVLLSCCKHNRDNAGNQLAYSPKWVSDVA